MNKETLRTLKNFSDVGGLIAVIYTIGWLFSRLIYGMVAW